MPRSVVYIDGLNLYYDIKRRLKERGKWLNLAALGDVAADGNEVSVVRYFTAKVTGKAGDTKAPLRQEVYLRALTSEPRIRVHFGQMNVNTKPVRLADPGDGKRVRMAEITVEKGSDSALAAYLVLDGLRDAYDEAVVVANDIDHGEPMRLVVEELGKKVTLVHTSDFPAGAFAKLPLSAVRPLWTYTILGCQFPDRVTLSDGSHVTRPKEWPR